MQLIKSKRKEDQDKLAKGSYNLTPQTQYHSNASYRTPSDAPRPIGGGDEYVYFSVYFRVDYSHKRSGCFLWEGV